MKHIQTNKAPQAIGPYSQAVVANGFVFCSGQIGLTPEGAFAGEDLATQTHQVIQNLKAVLEASGSSRPPQSRRRIPCRVHAFMLAARATTRPRIRLSTAIG
jgi:enamine deaminase RidA (YjgF/YER057c/UK114 family)